MLDEIRESLALGGGVYVEIHAMLAFTTCSLHATYIFTSEPSLTEPFRVPRFDQAKRNFGAENLHLTTRSRASLHVAHYTSLSHYTSTLTTCAHYTNVR